MKAALFIAWLAAMLQISWWTWHGPSPAPSTQLVTNERPSQPASNGPANTTAPNDDLDEFKAYEEVRQAETTRQFYRNGTLETLRSAWGGFCQPDGHKKLLAEVGYYYEFIDRAVKTAQQYHGPKVTAYVRERNNTTDDIRIGELVQQIYQLGYFTIDELPVQQRKLVSAVVKDEKPRGKACS